MKKLNRTLDLTVGIYNSEITAIYHRDGDITLKTPYVKWASNNGTLAFEKERFGGKLSDKIKWFFANNTLLDNNDNSILDYIR